MRSNTNENVTTKMKLAETVMDDDKEDKCNGEIPENPAKKPFDIDLHNDSSDSNPPGVGDLLVEDTNRARHEEDLGYLNGQADDNTSVSSGSSNFPIAEQDYISEEEIVLRLSDDEEMAPAPVESATNFFSSSPIPKINEDTPAEEKNESPTKTNSDDNLDNLISDLNEQSKTELKSENKDVTITDLRKEIEDFIKNHDDDDDDDEKTNEPKQTESEKSAETENKEEEQVADNNVPEIKNNTETNEKPDDDLLENSILDFDTSDEKLETENIEPCITKPETKEHIPEDETKEDIPEDKTKEDETNDEINEETDLLVPSTTKEDQFSETNDKTNDETNDETNEKESEIMDMDIIEPDMDDITDEIDNDAEIVAPEEVPTSEAPENDPKITPEIVESVTPEIEPPAIETLAEEAPENEAHETEAPESEAPAIETSAIKPNIEASEIELPTIKPTIEVSETEALEIEAPAIEPTVETTTTETNANETTASETTANETTAIDETAIEKTATEASSIESNESPEITNTEKEITDEELMDVSTDIPEKLTENIPEKILMDTDVEMEDLQTNAQQDKTIDKTDETINETLNENNATDKKDETNSIIDDKKDATVDKKDETIESINIKDAIVDTKDEKKATKIKIEGDTKEIKAILDSKKEEIKGENHDRREERLSLKRTLDNEESLQDAKKPKINGIKKISERVKLDAFREFMAKKTVATLTRAELEQFCIQKMCEALTQTSKLADLNRRVTQQETVIDVLRAKYQTVTKHVRDLEVVHSRVLQEVRTKCKENNCEVTPVKITRSVGLQVSLHQTAVVGRMRPQSAASVSTSPVAPPSPQDHLVMKRKIPQRTSMPTKLPSNNNNPTNMPPPKVIARSPVQGKGIKTILPKVYPPADPKDVNPNSLLENYLQNPNVSKNIPQTVTPRKSAPQSNSAPTTPNATQKVIDLTDEDDVQKATNTNTNSIRVVPQQQLQNTPTSGGTTLPRLTYLVQGNQQGQQVLLATSAAQPTRPGQVRSTLMFKPVAPGQVPPGQRLNIVRPNSVSGITVLPTTTTTTIRPGQQIRFTTPIQGPRPQMRTQITPRHPAPLPGPPAVQPSQPNWKAMPPKPALKITRVGDGIVLSWKMQNNKDMSLYEEIGSYQLYAYQETSGPPSTDMWRKVGDVKALALPMACTLTQFTDGNKYHFAVRAVDVKSRVGPFSQPEQIALP